MEKYEVLGDEFLVKARKITNGAWFEGIIASPFGDLVYDPYTKTLEQVNPHTVCRFTGLMDKNQCRIYVGDYVDVELQDGVFKFEACYGTVSRKVKNYHDFEGEYSLVNITGVYFAWSGRFLYPSVDAFGIPGNRKMRVIGNKFDECALTC